MDVRTVVLVFLDLFLITNSTFAVLDENKLSQILIFPSNSFHKEHITYEKWAVGFSFMIFYYKHAVMALCVFSLDYLYLQSCI